MDQLYLENPKTHWWFLVIMCILILLLTHCCGCADYAFMHKSQIYDLKTHFAAYRSFVEVKVEYADKEELIREGADNMDKTMDVWLGGWKP